MADDDEIDEEIEILFKTLSSEDFENMQSAPVIRDNFESINEILEPLRDTENDFQNPNLKITKSIRSKIQIILPTKELDKENENLIKDIQSFQKGYEENADIANQTIEKVKDSFKDLSNSVTALIKLIEDVKSKYFEQTKQMMSPFTKKNEELEKVDKSKFNDEKLKNFEYKNNKLDEKIKLYDQKLTKIIKDLKEVFKRMNKNIQGYLDLLNGLDKPINTMIEEIENIFNEFEEKSKEFINIIYYNPKEKEKSFKIFKEIQELNKKIIEQINIKSLELNKQNKALKDEKEKCSKDFNEIKKLENDSSKKLNDLQKEIKNILSEINELLKFCSLPTIEIKLQDFKGLQIDKIKQNVVEGTENILKANTKLEVDLTKLKKHIDENNKKINEVVTLDLAFIMDITGSMENYLNFAKEKIITIIDNITKNSNITVKLGFVGYRDYLDTKDKYLIYPELTEDYNNVKTFISKAKVGGGKDCEDMGGGLQSALKYDWRSNTRFALLIADAPCHGEQYHEIKKFDSYPKGDPKYKVDEIIKNFAEKNINIMCLNITDKTVKLYNNFVDYYQKGRKTNNSASIFVGILEEDKGFTEKLIDLIVNNAKKFYEKRHDN